MIRRAKSEDIVAVADIYNKIHEEEQTGRCVIGWHPDIYPVRATANDALNRGDLFVYQDENGTILASAIINQVQLDSYSKVAWAPNISEDEVMVLHTLTVHPSVRGKGIGRKFVRFYEDFARENHCRSLRLDTQSCNERARRFYPLLGYHEVGVVRTTFHDIRDIDLVLFEKVI